MSNGAYNVVRALKAIGIHSIFGVPGVNILPIFNEINRSDDIKLFICKNEAGAAYMADGYAKINGIGCCIGTTGPGITNMITGITCSYGDSIPVIAISAQVDQGEYGKYGIQEMTGEGRTPDMLAIMKNITKKQVRINRVNEITDVIFDCAKVAQSGRPGPVYIEIPANILLEQCENNTEVFWRSISLEPSIYEIGLARSQHDQIIQILETAKYPIIIAGGGCRSVDGTILEELTNKTGIPIVSTASAKTIFTYNCHNYLGVIGCYGNYAANQYLEKADVVLALGVCFTYLSTSGWSLGIESKYLMRIDIDDNELDRNYIPDIKICGDIRTIAPILCKKARENKNSSHIWDTVKNYKAIVFEEVQENNFRLDPIQAMQTINQVSANRNTHAVVDVGFNAYWAERYFNVNVNNGYIYNGSFGAMGYGVAASIGVMQAIEDNTLQDSVICICGDGGFLMNGMELSTAATYGIPVIWIVFNNHALGTQKAWVERNNMEVDCSCVCLDLIKCANSLGVEAVKTNSANGLAQALNYAFALHKPFLIDLEIIPDKYPKAYYGENVKKINR